MNYKDNRKYCILQNPGHNRVYFASSLKLALNELSIASEKLSSPVLNICETVIGGVEYIAFEKDGALTKDDLVIISRLSFSYAVFEMSDNFFIPLEKSGSYFFDDDLNTILKYSGKTNEIFTRMMINIAVFMSEFEYDGSINMLDPVCGKGTSLFEALTCGYNAYGVELSDKLVSECSAYFKKYLETKKYKHTVKKEKISGEGADGKKFRSERYGFELAKSKDDKWQNFEIVSGDTINIGKFYKKNTFHIIVGDLPYGIKHDNTAKGNSMRNPTDLLDASLPVWLNALKVGGCIVLAWNTFLLKRENIEKIFRDNNVYIPDNEVFYNFEHRVDQAINRDIIVGIKR